MAFLLMWGGSVVGTSSAAFASGLQGLHSLLGLRRLYLELWLLLGGPSHSGVSHHPLSHIRLFFLHESLMDHNGHKALCVGRERDKKQVCGQSVWRRGKF
ncbi:unnamed protein product [Boreogadus saida]